MLVKSSKKGEKDKEIWNRDHSISEGEVGKRIQNQARRVRTKETGAVFPNKAARRNDTAADLNRSSSKQCLLTSSSSNIRSFNS